MVPNSLKKFDVLYGLVAECINNTIYISAMFATPYRLKWHFSIWNKNS